MTSRRKKGQNAKRKNERKSYSTKNFSIFYHTQLVIGHMICYHLSLYILMSLFSPFIPLQNCKDTIEKIDHFTFESQKREAKALSIQSQSTLCVKVHLRRILINCILIIKELKTEWPDFMKFNMYLVTKCITSRWAWPVEISDKKFLTPKNYMEKMLKIFPPEHQLCISMCAYKKISRIQNLSNWHQLYVIGKKDDHG